MGGKKKAKKVLEGLPGTDAIGDDVSLRSGRLLIAGGVDDVDRWPPNVV